ncbi:FecR family protein [Sunxiuqinia sp. A32]|uniref:FecR family protein n=1 Tax=Sunxiuqinia sp. A32 TaxID=3461496 RepID=UPI004045CE62
MDKKDKIFWEIVTGDLYNELDEKEKNTFHEISRKIDHESTLRKIKKINSGLVEAHELDAFDKEKSWNTISIQVRKSKVRQLSVSVLKYAAILVFAILTGWISKGYLTQTTVEYTEIEVLDGQMGHIFLSDGTEVWLNSGSRFKYPNHFNRSTREVLLNGEGYFDVASDKEKPFFVKTSKLQVRVLGTEFNVMAYESENKQEVVLEEGKVQIFNLSGTKIGELDPGERIVRLNSSSKFIQDKVDTQNFTAWKDGVVVFEEETLEDIARKLERWYNVEVRFDEQNTQTYKITGTMLRNKPIDQVIQAIELLAPVDCICQTNLGEKDLVTIKKR